MAQLTCGGHRIALLPEETVLAGLERAGVRVPSSCRAGACQSCLVQVTRGAVSGRAQVGLKESLRAQGFVLACQAVPSEDWEVTLNAGSLDVPARIESADHLSEDIVRVKVRVEGELRYRAGQYLTLVRTDGLSRAYSIASLPMEGPVVELHVRLLPGGKMSSWLGSTAALGANLMVRGPAGECFYVEGKAQQPLVLAGVGSGLAPLWGILRDALGSGHEGPVELWHGARAPSGLYLREELRQLSEKYPNFSYRPCALAGEPADVTIGRLDELLLAATRSFSEPRFFLCGDAPLVQGLKRALFLRGAALGNIHADAFVGTGP